jgi:organic radical activating enzyme
MPFVSISKGRIQAQKLEYNLVDHCNLACRECSHFSPFLRAHALPLATFVRDLTRLAQVYHVQRLRFVGGEPLLNDDICAFVAAARESGITRDIEVVTNGVLLARVSDELLEGIDSLAVSVYPDRRPDDALLERTRERCRQFSVRMRVEWIDKFRKTQTATPVDDPQLLDGIFRSCLIAHAWSCQTIYDGSFYLCSRPIYTDTYLTGMAQPARDLRRADGVALHEPRLLERLETYLGSGTPLESCRNCLGTVGRYEPHSQLGSRERWRPQPAMDLPGPKVDGARLRALLRWQRLSTSLLRRLPSRRLSRALALAQTAFIGD